MQVTRFERPFYRTTTTYLCYLISPESLKMYTCNVALLFLTLSCFSTSKALPASCKPDWKIDWNQQPQDFSNFLPFSNPGEILPGVTVNDTLQFVGLLWNAPSWQEIVGRACIQYGPLLNGLYGPFPSAQYPNVQIRRECDMLITSLQKGQKSDIFGSCTSYWDQIVVENTTRSLLSDYDQCLRYNMKQDIPSFYGSMCDLDPLVTIYSTNLIEKTSRVAFDLLEWLGPSPFSGDMYGACSELRILLSNSIDQIIDNVKNLLRYPVADVLEYLNLVDICSYEDQTVRVILNLLPISQQDDEYICDFLSEDPTREEYLENGAKLIDTVLSVPVDDGLCTDVLTFVSSYDQYGVISYKITGRNLTSDSNRRQFCRDIATALSDNSPYTPTPYSFPNDQDIEKWQVFGEAGQLLPDFSFLDAVNVIGAFFRSDTLLDGGVVLCDVFESFLSVLEPPASVRSMCTALRNDDTATVETMCLTLSLQSQYYHPSLRIPTAIYMGVTGVDMTRKLFELSAISRDHVCSSLDDFFHSKNNLQSVVRFGLDVYLAELLPIADKICKDYDSVLDFLRRRTSMSFFEFRKFVQMFTDTLVTHLGFSDQAQFCQTIAAGIDDSSGRTIGQLAETIQEQVLLCLTDSRRCTESIQSFQQLLNIQDPRVDFSESVTQYTGYNSINFLCGNLSSFFDPSLCKAPSAGTMPKFCSWFIALAVWIVCLVCKL